MNIFATKSVSEIVYNAFSICKHSILQYASGEISINVTSKCSDCFVVSSVANNDDLIELVLLVNALKPANITLILLYSYYARSDKIVTGEKSNAYIIQKIIQNSGVSRIVHLDLHSNFFTVPNLAISAFSLFEADILEKNLSNSVIVAPDIGISYKAKILAQHLGLPFVQCYKTRTENNISVTVNADFQKKNCILVDDILDSCATMYNAGMALVRNGACSLACYCVHGVLSRKSVEVLKNLPVTDVVITDSIGQLNGITNVRQLSITTIIQKVVDGMLEECIYE